MKTDLQKTQHYTTNYDLIFDGLLDTVPAAARLVEPFVGHGDLLNLFPNHTWETYDIDSSLPCICQDTLKNPPAYADRWVITNPPFLAKNHASDKSYFSQYDYDDLYKIFLHTIIGCEGGIVIVPGNFFCDEGSEKIRTEFLSEYQVEKVNFFTYPVFDSTSYSVCAFSFRKGRNSSQTVHFCINHEQIVDVELEQQFGYQIGGRELTEIKQTPSVFSRLVASRSAKHPTHIYLYAADTKNERIRLEWQDDLYYGKSTDRMYATLDCAVELSEEQQRALIEKINTELNKLRDKYGNLLFTNYRDNNRKRVGFDFMYKFCSLMLAA